MVFVLVLPATAKEPAPVPYRSAPLIPWAKNISEHRFRSPRNYDDTVDYYRKIFRGNPHIKSEKIINTSTVRAIHFKNKRPEGRWEGLNVYEYKGAAWIYVVFSDEELARIEEEKQGKKKPKGAPEKGKKKKKKSG